MHPCPDCNRFCRCDGDGKRYWPTPSICVHPCDTEPAPLGVGDHEEDRPDDTELDDIRDETYDGFLG